MASLCVALLSFLTLLLTFSVQSEEGNPSLKWGTHRPGYYFGIRARHPRSPLFGFMWYDAGRYESISRARHQCQDGDKLSSYGWHRHNGDDFGQQIILDPQTNLQLIMNWLKFDYEDTGEEAWIGVVSGEGIPNGPNIASGMVGTSWYIVSGEHANDSAVRQTLSPHNEDFYTKKKKFAEGNVVQIDGSMFPGLFEDSDKSDDSSKESIYDFTIAQIMDEDNSYGSAIRPTKKKKMKATVMDKRTYVSALHMMEENKWKSKSIFVSLLENQAKRLYKKSFKIIEELYPDPQQQQTIYGQFSPNLKHGILGDGKNHPNIYMAQNYLIAPFKIYYVYLPTNKVTIGSLADLPSHIDSKEKIQSLIESKISAFDRRFERTFNLKLKQRPKDLKSDDSISFSDYCAESGRRFVTPGEMQLGRYALSNMIGGIGYWYGNQVWQMKPDEKPMYTENMELLSAVPSRSFFPRGFLWDEGFHQLLIGMWDMDLSLDIISSWLDSMIDLGWIPREQILGDEARSRVPQEFQIQRPNVANPPTMFMAINMLIRRYYDVDDQELAKIVCDPQGMSEDDIVSVSVGVDGETESELSDECMQMVKAKKDRLKRFLMTYYGKLRIHVMWYEITQRSPHDEERSFRWAGRTEDHCLPSGLDDYPRFPNVTLYEGHVDMHCWMIRLNALMAEIAEYVEQPADALKYREKAADLKVSLEEFHWNEEVKAYQDYVVVPEILEGEDRSNASGPLQKEFVNHIGYVSSFPFFLEVIDADNPHLVEVLKQLGDEEGMFSPWGLRSLAKNDPMYGAGEDYWRGAIWMNMNYLGVKALYDYKEQYRTVENPEDGVQEMLDNLYSSLRDNLIKNLYGEYAKFGFLYENYHGDTGNGQRSKPFTGWSSLILNIISEIYP